MPSNRTLWAGLALGVVPGASAIAQDCPDPLPPLPPLIVATAPVVAPRGGGLPQGLAPLDPVSLQTLQPKHVEHKQNSWHWRRAQGKILGYPEEFRPAPLGASVYAHGRAMVANGEAAHMVLHKFDFVDGSDQLKPRGLDELGKIAYRLTSNPYPLVIERTPNDPALAEARRVAVLSALATGPYPIDPARVVVAVPSAKGLSGINAQIIGANAMERVREFGPPIPINSNGVNSPSGVTGR